MEPKILYEDEYILALDKPSGLIVHSDGRSMDKTLVDWINEHYPNLKGVGENLVLHPPLVGGDIIERPGIVHRLDKDTSGMILVTKTEEAHKFLKEQFKNREVEKIYHCLVWGNFLEDKFDGVIKKPIGRNASDFRKWSAEHGAKGELREAVTEYKVLEQNKDFAYLEVKPKTGRTHQIRVHLKSISHPVVCDKLYAHNKVCNFESCLGFSRLALHALSIRLQLPSETYIKIESPLPPEFEHAKNLLKNSSKSDKMGE